MKTQIKDRFTGAVLFECDTPDDVSSGLAVRDALVQAKAPNNGTEPSRTAGIKPGPYHTTH